MLAAYVHSRGGGQDAAPAAPATQSAATTAAATSAQKANPDG